MNLTSFSLLAALALLTSCAPSRKLCERAYGPCGMVYEDSTTRTYVVNLPPASVHDTLFLDKWKHTFSTDTLIKLDTVVTIDENARVRLRRWYDQKLQAYRIECESLGKDTVFIDKFKTKAHEIRAPTQPAPTSWTTWLLIGLFILLILLIFAHK